MALVHLIQIDELAPIKHLNLRYRVNFPYSGTPPVVDHVLVYPGRALASR